MTLPGIAVYLKTTDLEYVFNPEEQETPHVYFDTVKGGFGGTEKRTLTYADGTVTGSLNGELVKKVLDFTSPDQLDGWTLVNDTEELDLPANDFSLAHEGYYYFSGKVGGILVIADKPIDIISEGDCVYTIPEPGVYISDAKVFFALVGEVTVASDEGPLAAFSKNVTVKAHTEYTAHINGRIGESGSSVLNAYGFSKTGNWSATDDPYIKVADCDGLFEIAKAALLAGRKVIGFINNTDNQAVHPILFESIVENWFESGMNGIRADAGLHNFLLASDNKLYHMLPSY